MKLFLILVFKIVFINCLFGQNEIVKDSFSFYFQKEIVHEESTSSWLDCGLPESNQTTKYQYYYIASDSNLILLKATNIDNSFKIRFFRRYQVNTDGGHCWFPDLMSIHYNKLGEIEKIQYFNGNIEPPLNDLKELKFER